jgi:hypothetical protein
MPTSTFYPGTDVGVTTNPLSQFAATTSAQLRGVITDPTGTGAAVFANTPTLVTPVLGAATGTSVNLSGDCKAATYHVGADAGVDGTGTMISAITVKKGIITAITVA